MSEVWAGIIGGVVAVVLLLVAARAAQGWGVRGSGGCPCAERFGNKKPSQKLLDFSRAQCDAGGVYDAEDLEKKWPSKYKNVLRDPIEKACASRECRHGRCDNSKVKADRPCLSQDGNKCCKADGKQCVARYKGGSGPANSGSSSGFVGDVDADYRPGGSKNPELWNRRNPACHFYTKGRRTADGKWVCPAAAMYPTRTEEVLEGTDELWRYQCATTRVCADNVKAEIKRKTTVAAVAEATVTVYQEPNFGGTSYSYGIGDYSTIGLGLEDNISSVKVPAGLKVVLYEHPDLQGKMLTLTAGEYPYLQNYKFGNNTADSGKTKCYRLEGGSKTAGCWDNIVSSLRVTKA